LAQIRLRKVDLKLSLFQNSVGFGTASVVFLDILFGLGCLKANVIFTLPD
jgi:hypothetical protein